MLRDMGRRLAITVILSGIILGGMSISLANMPSSPPRPNGQNQPLKKKQPEPGFFFFFFSIKYLI
ncbi:hypothetical protein BKP29_0209285 [Bacillus licheniformis]|nr:hypothetical protein BKP29_0209285 [Bacillus licheniformis]